MKKIRWIWISLLAAGAVAALVALEGCSRQGLAGRGYRGGRHTEAYEAVDGPRGDRRESKGASWERSQGRQSRIADSQPGRQGRAVDSLTGRQAGGQRYTTQAEPTSNGRSIVETGRVADLSGSLDRQGTEWYLVMEGARLALHLGNTRYVESTGIQLQEGVPAKVLGFVDGQEVAVVSIQIDGRLYAFRTEDGVPLWAGRGQQAGNGGRGGRGGGGTRLRS